MALLPEVERLIRDAAVAKAAYDRAEGHIQLFKERVMLLGGVVVDHERLAEDRQTRDRSAERLKRGIERCSELGCQVKDLDTGLVDFPTRYRGQEVCLCWMLGETGIGFWHGMEEGFAGRKPIDQDFLDHHEGGPAE